MKTHKVLSTLIAAALAAAILPLAAPSVSADGSAPATYRIVGNAIDTEIVEASGIAVAADGTRFVADVGANRIIKFEPGAVTWTLVTSVAGGGDGLDQVSMPAALHIDAVGDMYVTDKGNNRIMRWTPGATEGVVVAGGNGSGAGLDQLSSPSQVAFGDDGEMYVADTYNSRIMRYDDFDPVTPGTLVAGTGTFGSSLSDLSIPTGVATAAGANPDIFVADPENNRIMRFTQGSAEGVVYVAGQVDSCVEGVTMSFRPVQLFKYDDLLAATDSENNCVVTIDDFERVTRLAGDNTASYAAGAVRRPHGATIFDGQLFVAEEGRVSVWTPYDTGQVLMGPMSTPVVPFSAFAGTMRIGADTGIYVTDVDPMSFLGRVLQIEPISGNVAEILLGAVDGVPVGPIGGLIVTSDHIYVSDSINHRVVRFPAGSTVGEIIAGFGGPGNIEDPRNGLDQLNFPQGIDINSEGSVFIADSGNDRVVRWDAGATEGVVVAGTVTGTGLDQLVGPYDVRVAADASIFVADRGNHRIVRWDADATEGVVVAGGNGYGFAANQTYEPEYIALDGNGGVYVSSYASDRVAYWAQGATTGVTLFNALDMGRPAGVDVDATGRTYAVDLSYRGLIGQVLDAEMSFDPVGDKILGSGTVSITLNARSGSFPDVISMTPAVCSVASLTVTLNTTGTCTLRADTVGALWTTSSTTTSFEITAPATTTPPTTVPPTTTPPVTTPPVTTPPVTTPPVTTPPVTTPPVTAPPAAKPAALTVRCSASGTRVRCQITKPKKVAKKAKVSYKTVCVAGAKSKSSSGKNANTRVVLIVKTGKGTWRCTTTAKSGASTWQRVSTVKVR